MELTTEGRPSFSCEIVQKNVQDLYGIEGVLEPLPAEWDQNFRLDGGEAGTFVVKIANRARSIELLEFENAAMKRLSELWSSGKSPRVVASLSGNSISTISGSEGVPFRVRVLTYLPGRSLATAHPVCERTLDRLGYALGDLDRCLFDFRHPAMNRDLRWDLRQAEWISSHTHRISNVRRRGIVERLVLQHRARVAPVFPELSMSVIHNDAND